MRSGAYLLHHQYAARPGSNSFIAQSASVFAPVGRFLALVSAPDPGNPRSRASRLMAVYLAHSAISENLLSILVSKVEKKRHWTLSSIYLTRWACMRINLTQIKSTFPLL